MLRMNRSDAKIFSVPGSERCPVKTLKNYLGRLNPTSDALFPAETERWSTEARSSILQKTKSGFASRYRATSHKPLPESYICHSALGVLEKDAVPIDFVTRRFRYSVARDLYCCTAIQSEHDVLIDI